uniref:F-box domain-containing protein n=1 Tax=Aegilops tauschii TaxID=37682 RepID=N1QU30_AEGTA
MAAADRLSTRPDDVLVRILSLAPKNEAAATALLSRRWRSLWRRTSAVNLDSRPYAEAERGLCSFYPSRLQSFFRDAHAILAALQGEDMVDAAPALTSLTLVNVSQRAVKLPGSNQRFYEPDYFMLPLRLRCLTFNALVLVTYVDKKAIKASAAGGSGIELDMPSLRFFRFKGYPVKLSLTSPAPGLARVDFDVDHRHQGGCEILNYEPLSRMTASFSSTRALKVRLKCIEDIVADEDEDAGIILPTFPNLKLLELDGEYQYMDSNTAVATARILRSCPVMSELRLRLAMRYYNYWYDRKHEDPVGGPFSESMDRFERLASMSSAVDLGGVSELPDALTNDCAFRCLQTSLRKVTLQFKAKEVNCFPAQLAKFLVENAMVLEEMHVNDGSQFWLDHLCHKEMERRVFPAEEPAGRGRRVSSVPAAAG